MKQGKRVLMSCLVMWVVIAFFGMRESFAWDGGYAYQIADYAENTYKTGDIVNEGQCTALVVDALQKVTGITKTGDWSSQAAYETGLNETSPYQGTLVSHSEVERGLIFTVEFHGPQLYGPHIGIVSDVEYNENGNITNLIVTDGNRPSGSLKVCKQCSGTYMLSESSLHFWRVGKSKSEQPTPTPAFNEYPGIPAEGLSYNLTNHYYYSWMDSTGENFTHIMIANPSSATATANVTITLAGVVLGTYSLRPGEIAYPRFDGQRGGPIEVTSDINILTTQRTHVGSGFSEYAGIPANSLTNHYYYSWMDSTGENFTHIMIANPSSATATANVTITLAGAVLGTYSLRPGEIAYPRFDGQRGGPIEVTSDINILTTQRTHVGSGFSEYAGIPANSLTNHYYYSWMDSTGENFTHTVIANPSATATANVTIKLAGAMLGTYSLEPGKIAYPRFDGQRGGPIEVVSDINILTTQRTQIKISGSSSATPFIEENQPQFSRLTYHYYYLWMDSTGENFTHIVIANPSTTATANVAIKLAGKVLETYSLKPGTTQYPRFDGQRGGPIEVASDINILTTQRTQVGSGFGEYAGIPVHDIVSGQVNVHGGNLALANGTASVIFPSDAVTQLLTVTILQVDDALVPASNLSDSRLSKAYELTAVNESGESVTQFAKSIAVVLHYDQDVVNAVNESLLTIKFYDELSKTWVELPSTVDSVNYTVTALTNHFTKFAVFGPTVSVPPVVPDPPVDPNPPVNPPSAVPEPATVCLFGVGLLGLLALLRQHRQQK